MLVLSMTLTLEELQRARGYDARVECGFRVWLGTMIIQCLVVTCLLVEMCLYYALEAAWAAGDKDSALRGQVSRGGKVWIAVKPSACIDLCLCTKIVLQPGSESCIT